MKLIVKLLLFLSCLFLLGTKNPPKKQICFIVNPVSGIGKQKKIKSLIKKHLDKKQFDYQIVYTKRAKHATELAKQALEKKFDLIVAVGGDGTINEIAQALIVSSTPLGIIPMGSGNGLSRHFNIPHDPKKAIEVINEQHSQWIDTVKINQTAYIGVAGIGFDAEVSHAFAELEKRGFSSYIKVIIGELPHYKPKEYELVIDGKSLIEKAFLICFANSKQYGNNAFIAPHALIDDGYLDVIILKEFPKHATPKLVHDLFNRHIEDSKYTIKLRCQEVIIKKPLQYIHLDGEPMQFSEDVYIRVLPSSLKMITPKKQFYEKNSEETSLISQSDREHRSALPLNEGALLFDTVCLPALFPREVEMIANLFENEIDALDPDLSTKSHDGASFYSIPYQELTHQASKHF